MAGIRLRVVDAFTDRPFAGNPAGVVVLERMPSDHWMAAVAGEVNHAETGFVVADSPADADYTLRWFTRGGVEMDLCGHATLASAHCLFDDGIVEPIRFSTRSGVLTVSKAGDGSLAMEFPAWPPEEAEAPQDLAKALGLDMEWVGRGGNGYLVVRVADEGTLRRLTPDIQAVAQLPDEVIVVTAPADPGKEYQYVCRVFGPRLGIDEDPVTGSAATNLGPYWSEQLDRMFLLGFQASERTGLVGVEVQGDHVVVSGNAVTVLDGTLTV